MRRALSTLSLLAGLAACSSKQSDTKIVVVVWSDLAVPSQIDKIRILAKGTTPSSPADFPLIGKTDLPAVLVLVPPDNQGLEFEVTATGYLKSNAVVSQAAHLSFVSGESRVLNLFLNSACKDVPCPTNQTCSSGSCKNVDVDVNGLPDYVPNAPFLPPDAGAGVIFDGGPDVGAAEAGGAGTAGVDAVVKGQETGDSAADRPVDVPLSAPDSGVAVIDGGVDTGAGGTAGSGGTDGATASTGGAGGIGVGGSGDAGVPDVPGAQPDVPIGRTGGGVDTGVAGSGGNNGGADSAVTNSGGSAFRSDGSAAGADGVTSSGGSDAGIDSAVTSSDGSMADISCDFTAQGMHLCTGFAGLSADAAAQEQTVCAQQNQGTFSQAACLAVNASATCTFTSTGTGQFAGIPAGIVVTYVWYSLSASQIAAAQLVCSTTLGGSWSTSSGGSDAGIDAAVTSSDGSIADISCDFTAQGMHLCTGFAGLSADAAAQEQTVCTQQNQGTFSQAACLAVNASVTCTFTSTGTGQFAGIPAGIVVTYVWYSLSASQIAAAQLVCSTTLGGSWSDG